jgi:ATP-binding cassette subfamily B protein
MKGFAAETSKCVASSAALRKHAATAVIGAWVAAMRAPLVKNLRAGRGKKWTPRCYVEKGSFGRLHIVEDTATTRTRSRLRRAARLFVPHRGTAALIVLFALVVAGLTALEPLVLKMVFDDLGRGGHQRVLVIGLAVLLAIGVVREAVTATASGLTWRTRLAVHYDLLDATVDRLHRMPVSFYRSEGVGAIMTRVDRGIQGVVSAASEIAFSLLPAVVYLIVAVGVMLSLEWRLALVVLAIVPLPPLVAALAAPEQKRRERRLLDRWVSIYSRFNEVLSGIVTVKSFSREEDERRRFIGDVGATNAQVIAGVWYDARVQAGQNLIVSLARVVALGVGGTLALNGRLTIGTLVAFLGYVGGLFAPVQGLTSVYRTLRTASVSVDTVFAILDAEHHLDDAPDAIEAPPLRGEVIFENVTFGYSEATPLLMNVDLHVSPGERVALVGPSGAGKSTLMSLLLRFYDPVTGRVLVDGFDVRRLKQGSLRRQIAVVLQDALLFDDTLYDNILYGRPQATREEVEAAARAAHAHEFISRLPAGYETRAGERGGRLSAGERQRIAIARALLKAPPILVLDEATSALDAESEALVNDALDKLVAGRTTFVIAHRLATVVGADRVLVLKDGRIIESGRHDELVEADGYYASLVQKQTRGLLPATFYNRRSGQDRRAEPSAVS